MNTIKAMNKLVFFYVIVFLFFVFLIIYLRLFRNQLLCIKPASDFPEMDFYKKIYFCILSWMHRDAYTLLE